LLKLVTVATCLVVDESEEARRGVNVARGGCQGGRAPGLLVRTLQKSTPIAAQLLEPPVITSNSFCNDFISCADGFSDGIHQVNRLGSPTPCPLARRFGRAG
jgi:hypothetical protein